MNLRSVPGAAAVPHDRVACGWCRAGDVALEDVSAIKATLAALPANADLSDRGRACTTRGRSPPHLLPARRDAVDLRRIEQGAWLGFDALECYHAVGGNGTQGVDPHLVLDYMKQPGLLDVDTKQRYRSRATPVRPWPQGQIDVVKAALAANRPAVLAMLLPPTGGKATDSRRVALLTRSARLRRRPGLLRELASAGATTGSIGSLEQCSTPNKASCYAYTAVDAADGANG